MVEAIKFRPLKNFDKLEDICVGDIIGMGQLSGNTLPATCLENDGEFIKALADMDGDTIIEYNFHMDSVEGFYKDGSIILDCKNTAKYFKKEDEGYDSRKEILEERGLM